MYKNIRQTMAPLMLEAIFGDITTYKWASSPVTPKYLLKILAFFALFWAKNSFLCKNIALKAIFYLILSYFKRQML